MSERYFTCRFSRLAVFLICLISGNRVFSAGLQVAWDPSPDPRVKSYNLYFGEVGSAAFQKVSVGFTTSATLNNLKVGVSYLVYTTALDALGIESQPSNILTHVPTDVSTPTGSSVLSNGSFEEGYAGWVVSGNLDVLPSFAHQGLKSLRFNAGDTTPNGSLYQRFTTIPGTTYALTFYFGAFSQVNHDAQNLQVYIQGASLLKTDIVIALANTPLQYTAKTYSFVADSSTATIAFSDISRTTRSVDMYLDDVRVAITAAAPSSGGSTGGSSGGSTGGSTPVVSSFESGYGGWSSFGNQRIIAGFATDGNNAVQFNFGQLPPNGEISKVFSTVPTRRYQIGFDLGAFGASAREQRMEVSAQGVALLLSEIYSIFAPGAGSGVKWSAQTGVFKADSSTTVVKFRDVSKTSDGVDLYLDKVSLIQVP